MRHFTLIIPTRNRADTLYWSIKSCLSQDYERMTVLVSDNCSSDKTQEVLASFSDPRLRSVRTPSPTSMSGNLEFALSHVLDEDTHITVIGDDDGLLPGGFAFADRALSEHSGSGVLTWKVSNYCWPSCGVTEWRNNLQLSLSDHAEILNSAEMMAALADCSVYYHHLPGLWTSLVPAALLREFKNKHGRVVFSSIPDASTAVLTGCVTESYLYTQRSVTILGSSSHSNGVSISTRKPGSLEKFLDDNTIPPHPDLEFTTHAVYYVIESLLYARDLGILPPRVQIDLPKVLRLMLVRQPAQSDEMHAAVCEAAAQSAARHGIPFDVAELISRNEAEGAAGKLFNHPSVTRRDSEFSHRCSPLLVSNIFEATALAGELMSMRRNGEVSLTADIQPMENKLIQLQEQRVRAKAEITKLRGRCQRLNTELEAIKASHPKNLLRRMRDRLRHRP